MKNCTFASEKSRCYVESVLNWEYLFKEKELNRT